MRRQVRGRSANHLRARNTLLLHRYYYYVILKKRQYANTLDELSREHFLSTITIANILVQNYSELKQIYQARPTERTLARRWSWMRWQ